MDEPSFRTDQEAQAAYDRTFPLIINDIKQAVWANGHRYTEELEIYKANQRLCSAYNLEPPVDTVCKLDKKRHATEKALVRTISSILRALHAETNPKTHKDVLAILRKDTSKNLDWLFYMAVEDATVHLDIKKALSDNRFGTEIASSIRFSGLAADELSVLATLHKEKKHQRKIETMLRGLNMDEIAWDFRDRNYEPYISKEDY